MTPPRLLASFLVVGAALAPATARAQDAQVVVVEFSGTLEGGLADAPKRLTETMTAVVNESGTAANQASRDDVLGLAGCADTGDECMKQAVGMLGAKQVVVGEVAATGDGQVEVVVRVISADEEPRHGRLVLSGSTTDEIESSFRTGVTAFWRGEPPPETAPPEPPPAPAEPDKVESEPARSSFSAGAVRPYSWAIAGTGVGMLVIGGLLLVAANGKQGEVDDAPTESPEDFEALVELEDSGRRYARWGNTLVVVGGVAAIVGGVLIWRQGTRRRSEAAPMPMTLAPTLLPDAVGLTLTVRTGR